jgi:hypothetical protein
MRSINSEGDLVPPDLSKAVIISVTVLDAFSDAPFPVTVKLDGQGLAPLNTLANEKGERSLYVVPPGRDAIVGQEIYKPPPFNSRLMDQYSHLAPEELQEGLHPVGDKYFVELGHPILDILYINRGKYPTVIEDAEKSVVENRWVPIPRRIVDECLEALRLDVLSALPHANLTTISASLSRADGAADFWYQGTKYEAAGGGPTDQTTVDVLGAQRFTVRLSLGILYSISRRRGPAENAE